MMRQHPDAKPSMIAVNKIQDDENPYAIIIGLDSMQGLQVARILAGHDVPVIAIASNPDYYACSTNVCKHILFADTGADEVIEVLKTLGPQLKQKAVLYPCHDKSVLKVSQCRSQLAPWYHLVLPEHQVVEMLMDKVKFYTYAQEAGSPIPETYFLYGRADAEAAAQKLTYPCALKPPYRPHEWTRHTKQKAFKVADAEELLALYDHYHRWSDVLIAQQWIEGPEANLYSCNCYFDKNGHPVATFVARKLRQWPPLTGQSCLGEEVRNDFVLQETLRLFCSVGYRGLGYVEMKCDDLTGKYYIVEPNVGRPTGRSAIAEAGGVELHYTMYCDALNRPLPPNRQQKYEGVKWIHLLRDLQSAFYYWRRGKLTPKQWWRSVRGRKAYAIFSWRDPRPFLKALQMSLPVLLSPRERGEKDY
jgi:predicted ATP-grasp superfamily ATP-dependent carboligase